MAAPTTIHDLPDDMLHEIFGHVFASEPGACRAYPSWPTLYVDLPLGAHQELRCVCRRWRDIADWVWLSKSLVYVRTSELADADAVRARHPAAIKRLELVRPEKMHSTKVSQVAVSLINGSADLRRALSFLQLTTCCLPSLVPAVTPVASCTALTMLHLFWGVHENEPVVPSDMLAPLSALRMLNTLFYTSGNGLRAGPRSALLAPLPALPDAPSLTCLSIDSAGNFVPVGSDAALGRLRRMELKHSGPVLELLDAEDPFLLRKEFDAGTWQPSRLTGLQELDVFFFPVSDRYAPARQLRQLQPSGTPAGTEWASLAGQITALTVTLKSTGYNAHPSTGIVAGLGALTALRKLRVNGDFYHWPADNGRGLELVSLDHLRAPNLTKLKLTCTSTPVNVAQFPNLVRLHLASVSDQPPLNLRSLVARSSLKTLTLGFRIVYVSVINLAELFVGGNGWPVLEELSLHYAELEWDATTVAGAPTAAEFADRARQLLPALATVEIFEPTSSCEVLVDPSRFRFVLACGRHVVPALLELDDEGGG